MSFESKKPYCCSIPVRSSGLRYLRVIKPLKWANGITLRDELMGIGSITWTDHWHTGSKSVLIEDNRYEINFDINCFELIELIGDNYPKTNLIPETQKDIPLKRYRFRTKEEIRSLGKMDQYSSISPEVPCGWSFNGSMNHYLGKVLSEAHQGIVRKMIELDSSSFYLYGCTFNSWNIIELEDGYVPISNKDEIISTPKPIEQVDLKDPPKFHSSSSTIQQTATITYESKEEKLNDDIVIESTINITI